MPTNFADTPTSTTTLSANSFPVSAVFVPGTASGKLIALQGGPASTDGNAYTSAPVAMYVASGNIVDGGNVALGTTTDASSANTLIGIAKAIKANTASVVIGSGTITANQGGSWAVTANAGTNLNTSALALDTSVNGLLAAQGSTTSGQKGPLLQGAVTTSAPAYTPAQTSPISLTLAGAVRVDASATTQPVSGTFWQATQPVSAASLPLPTGAATAAKQPALGTAGTPSSDVLSVQGIASMTAIKVDGSGVTQPVSGTMTANIGTTNGLALDATLAKLNVAQGAALGSNTGPLLQGSVTTASPSYSTGNIDPISLTTAGAIRVDSSATTQPVSGTVTANAGTNLNTSLLALESGGNLATVAGAITGAKVQANTAQINGVAPTMGNGVSGTGVQRVTIASDSTGQVALAAGSNVVGSVTIQATSGTALQADQFNTILKSSLYVKKSVAGDTVLALGSTTSANSLPVVVASDQGAIPVSQSGTWTVQPSNTPNTSAWLVQDVAGTTGGATTTHLVSASGNNATNVKASAGLFYGFSIANTNAAARYVHFYNKASVPTVGTDVPVATVQIPGNGTVIRAFPVGATYSTGISFGTSTGASDTDSGSVGAGDLVVDLEYK